MPSPVQFKAQPVPDLSHPFEPKHTAATITVEPFERMEKYADPIQQRAKLQEDEYQKLASQREFRANPIRTDLVHVAPVEVKPATVPEPFSLESEKRHEEYQLLFQEKIEKIVEQEKALSETFKAQPLKKFAPFVAKKSTKPLTQVCIMISL